MPGRFRERARGWRARRGAIWVGQGDDTPQTVGMVELRIRSPVLVIVVGRRGIVDSRPVLLPHGGDDARVMRGVRTPADTHPVTHGKRGRH